MADVGIFTDENVAQGIPPNSNARAGVFGVDTLGVAPERGKTLPSVINDEVFSWINYQCWIETELDSGMAVHRPLPQNNYNTDELGQEDVYSNKYPSSINGVNIKSNGKWVDISQRMSNSIYIFCLKGWAIRVKFQIPIPKMISFGGIDVIPIRQKVMGPVIIGNNSGIPVYYATWELWYTISGAPRDSQLPPPNLSEHISASDTIPNGIQYPLTTRDSLSIPSAPTGNNPIRRSAP